MTTHQLAQRLLKHPDCPIVGEPFDDSDGKRSLMETEVTIHLAMYFEGDVTSVARSTNVSWEKKILADGEYYCQLEIGN